MLAPHPPRGPMLSSPNEDRWRNQAACIPSDPDLFFPLGTTGIWLLQTEDAKTVCRRCPVMTECRQYAMDHRIEYGVWGGLSEAERHHLSRRTARKKEKVQP